MALDLARPLGYSQTSGATWRDYVVLSRQKQRPRWLLLVALTAATYLAMPVLHQQVFGLERVQASTVEAVEEMAGAHLGDRAREAVREQVASRPPVVTGAMNMVAGVIAIILAGTLLNMGALLVGAELTAAQALSITALSSLVVALLRVMTWLAVVTFLNLDKVPAIDWGHLAQANMTLLAGDHMGKVLLTFLGSLDMFSAVGVVVSVAGLRAMDTRISVPAAVGASIGWTLVVVTFRMGLSALLGMAIV